MNELRVKIFDTTRSIKLMDEFDGIGEKNNVVYDRLVIYNENLLAYTNSNKVFNYALIIERGKNEETVGSITMTSLKNGYLNPNVYVTKEKESKVVLLKEHVGNEITEDVYDEYVDSGKPYFFSKPYQLRAQNSNNKSGYGNIYYGDVLIHEGTKYGETSRYIIVGIFVFKSDGLWGHYDKQWGEIEKRY